MKIVEQSVDCLACTPDAVRLIEAAGRTCYKSEDKITDTSAEQFVRMVLKRGHESVIEHASATFRVVCDRGISHEIVRHRIASFSQESTRYCNYGSRGGEIKIVESLGIPENVIQRRTRIMELVEEEYLLEIKEGLAPQVARDILPTYLKTEIVWTANFREWRHVMRLRKSKAAHPKIRIIAGLILEWFKENYPVIVEDLINEN